MKHKTTIIDLSNIVWGNYHKVATYIPDDDKRQPTAVINQTLQSVSLAIENTEASVAICASDAGGRPQYRKDVCPEYKGHREETPVTIPAVLEAIGGILDKYGVITLAVDGYEADDIWAQIAYHYTANQLGTVTGVSRDNDWTLPVAFCNGNAAVYDQKKKTTLYHHTMKEHAEEFCGRPLTNEQFYQFVLDSKAIVGDKSDNVTGFKGVGKVTAEKWAKHLVLVEFEIGECDPKIDARLAKLENFEEIRERNRTIINPYHCLPFEPVISALETYEPNPVDSSEEELEELLHLSLAKTFGRFHRFEARRNIINSGKVDSLPKALRDLL